LEETPHRTERFQRGEWLNEDKYPSGKDREMRPELIGRSWTEPNFLTEKYKLCILKKEGRYTKMRNLTVNISFQERLLAEIDAEAKRESRTRSELLREAARLYVRRQKQWDRVFALGDDLSKRGTLAETDVTREIQNVGRRKRKSL
jgi:CopG family transcriptional regulator/antitoxin EndoAI